MKNIFIRYPILYLILFCLLAFVSGIEIGDIIKNGLSEKSSKTYLLIFGIVINLFLAFYFLSVYIKIRNNESKNIQ
jgi:hypothetical protein